MTIKMLTMEKRMSLWKEWLKRIKDLMILEELKLPPLRTVNHDIPLINENLRIHHRPSKCPEPLLGKLKEKVDRYLKAGLWKCTTLPLSTPMMIVIKKDGNISTVIDARQRNDNTLSDDTPMPDQELIRNAFARARYRTKLDLSDAYKQMRINPEHLEFTVFETPFGNMLSEVMQQGDKNGPSSFQRLINIVFIEVIGIFIYRYQDDIFIYSNMWQEHQEHLGFVFR